MKKLFMDLSNTELSSVRGGTKLVWMNINNIWSRRPRKY